LPPVRASTDVFADAMLSLDVTSRARVDIPSSSRSVIWERLRAVAMTWRPVCRGQLAQCR
jgi:hypothetical protein